MNHKIDPFLTSDLNNAPISEYNWISCCIHFSFRYKILEIDQLASLLMSLVFCFVL